MESLDPRSSTAAESLIASKEEAGESDDKGRGCLDQKFIAQKFIAQKFIAQSDSDRAAHKKTDRSADKSETRALAKDECSTNKSNARDNLAGNSCDIELPCIGAMRRVRSHERTKRVRIPQWFKDDGLEMRGRRCLSSYAYKRPNRFAMKSSQVTSSMRTSPCAGVFPCAKRSTIAVIPAAVVN